MTPSFRLQASSRGHVMRCARRQDGENCGCSGGAALGGKEEIRSLQRPVIYSLPDTLVSLRAAAACVDGFMPSVPGGRRLSERATYGMLTLGCSTSWVLDL